MAGLVGYGSSDEEDIGEDVGQNEPSQTQGEATLPQEPKEQEVQQPSQPAANGTVDHRMAGTDDISSPSEPPKAEQPKADQPTTETPMIGPVMGPSRPPETDTSTDLPEATPSPQPSPNSRPLSPYSANRALLRDLTLPSVPNLDIPPSPPGTPPPSLEALNTKFTTLLELKRKNGTHFNERLAQSSAMRNPALMDKLLEFVGVEVGFEGGKGAGQYATTLPGDMWDPEGFPEWVYKGALRKANEKVQKERERARGEPVEFVAAGGAAGPAAVGGGGGKRKTRFDT